MRRVIIGAVLILCIGAAGFAIERFPPPDFTTGYQFPEIITPAPREIVLEYVDIAVLVIALALAAYFSLKKRSRLHLVVLVIFAILYFGFYRKGCICSIGAIQNISLAIFDTSYALPLTVAAFFAIPVVVSLFFGRVFCAAVCPLGAVQEVVLLKPLTVPKWLDDTLGVIPFIYLGAAVLFAATGSAFVICRYDPFVQFFWLGGDTLMFIIGGAVILLSVFVGRPYCRYACPLGAVFRLTAPLSQWQPSISTHDECINCSLCADACPYGAILPSTPERQEEDWSTGRKRLTLMLALVPVMIAAGGYLGHLSAPALSKVHPNVRLADRLWLEEQGVVQGYTEQTEAFDIQGRPSMEAYAEAAKIRGQFDIGTVILGGWIGLVLGVRLVSSSIRRRRTEYSIDQAKCVACGRCYGSCPQDLDAYRKEHDLPAGEPL